MVLSTSTKGHGVEHVDEGHLGDGRGEQLGTLVEHGTDQQAAGAAPADDHLRGCAESVADQFLGAGDEVAEGVLLVLQLAGAVPRLAELAAAAHVGDGEDEAPLQQAQPSVAEPGVETLAIGAVAVEV
jgi:hypothetical protein